MKDREYPSLAELHADMRLLGANCATYCRGKYPEMVAAAKVFMEVVDGHMTSGANLLLHVEQARAARPHS